MKVRFLAAAALCLILSAAVPLTVRAEVNPDEVDEPYVYSVSYDFYYSSGSYSVYDLTYTSDVPICFVQTKQSECYGPGGQKFVRYNMGLYYYLPSGKDTLHGVQSTGHVENRKDDGSISGEYDQNNYEYAHPLPLYLGAGQGYAYYRFETDAPIFSSHDAALHYLTTGDASGAVNAPVNHEYVYEPSIETPRLVFEGYQKFQVDNATEGYSIEVQGRCYSIDDIELFKQNLQWKYKYETVLKNDLTTWVSIGDAVNSCGVHDLAAYGADSFEDLLSKYPIEDRNYYGGTNAVGNYFSGYSDALEMLKTVHLPSSGSLFNGKEIYVRFYYLDDQGIVHHGKWCHWYGNLAEPEGSSGSQWDDKENMFTENQSTTGLTDGDKDDLEGSGNSRQDEDAMPEYNNTSGWMSTTSDKLSENLWKFIGEMSNGVKGFPEMVARVFSWLPPWLIVFISIGMSFIVILRFLGR